MATEGVEKEEHSRFVDYTTATAWEELVADIERLITRWHKRAVGSECEVGELSYMGYTFRLAFYEGEAATVSAIHRWYDVSSFALFARTNDWIDLTPSEMKSIFSALICGLQASGSPVPVYFASSSTERLEEAAVVLGYEICPTRSSWGKDTVRHYESSLLDFNIDAKHDLFFIDGLLKHFKASIHNFASISQLRLAVGETFTHMLQNDAFDTSSHTQIVTSKVSTRAECIVSSLGRCRRSRGAICQQVSVHLEYSLASLENLQDNTSYTTLVPSKQPADSWRMEASFQKNSSSSLFEAGVVVHSLGYASCLRRLLALYIYGKSVDSGVRMVEIKSDSRALERASSVSSILSVATSHCLATFALSNVQDDGAEMKTPSSDKDCFQVLFSHREPSPNDAKWSSLLAVLVGCSEGAVEDTADLWRNCLRRLRAAWDSKEVGGFRFLGGKHSCETVAAEIEVAPSVPLWKRSLWEDLLHSEGKQLSLPDVEESIFMQKLQVLRFCTAVKECATTVECNYSHEIAAGTVEHFPTPCLVRRNPLTYDAEAMNAFASQYLSGIVGSVGSLSLKVRLPAVVSDICAFKAANPTADFGNFRHWYQIDLFEETEQDFKVGDFEELWGSLGACEATMQRPMFRAEAEAEKALNFLESITPIQFAAEMLIVAMSETLPLLEGAVREWAVSTEGDASSAEVLQILGKVKDDAVCASQRIRNDVAQFGSSAADSSISQDTLMLIDGICQEVFELETFCIKARELDFLLTLPEETSASRLRQAGARAERRRLVVSLARFHASTALDGGEAKRMQGLARAFSRGNRPAHHHTWHSTDGRELPLGSNKTVTISSLSDESLRAIIEPARIRLCRKL